MKKNIALFSLACLFLFKPLHGAASKPFDDQQILEALSTFNLPSPANVFIIGPNDDRLVRDIIKKSLSYCIILNSDLFSLSYINSDTFDYGESEEYDAIISL